MTRLLAILLLLALTAALRATPPAPLVVVVVPAPPANEREAWALDLLARLGNATPTPATVAFVVAWTIAEDSCTRQCGYSSAFERNNPLNTTQTGYGETFVLDSDGVKAYPTYEAGMAATLQTLSYGYYTEIVAGLLSNDPERAKAGLIASPWAGSRYHGGANWPQYGEAP